MLACLLVLVLLLTVLAPRIRPRLPPGYDPFAPLSVDDPPTFVTRYKLKRLAADPAACLAALDRASAAGRISFVALPDAAGPCPLSSPVRIRGFGPVTLSSSFLASCPLALSSAMFVGQAAAPLAAASLASPLARIDHLGSYACRNIYHRRAGRLSEHAEADALDVAGFTLADGRRIPVLQQWRREDPAARYLHAVFGQSCDFFGNSLGPDYNAAHANHFHLGMRGFGVCR
ncbi:extensin [Enterobacteriales bacterium SAP-6]|uniref:Extensin n=1 Tax=Acerihabitans arboris TaxID=2691583 RepID=A0A845SJ54_9GAMM|nr:extensin family protein [Acerihabitans arboris]NDL64950.1 extensin [Acerihabitans arboris]